VQADSAVGLFGVPATILAAARDPAGLPPALAAIDDSYLTQLREAAAKAKGPAVRLSVAQWRQLLAQPASVFLRFGMLAGDLVELGAPPCFERASKP
jgi:hypothetical protein